MTDPTPATPAATFRRLHEAGNLLVLVNAWDAGTAILIEAAGAPAIATTSAGVAWSHGYPDGDALPTDLLLGTVAAILRVVAVPVTVDIEAGYADDPAAVGALAARLAEAGAVGINLEDGTAPPDLLCRKIEHVKQAVAWLGLDLFVNARTDVYLRALAPEGDRVAESLRRGARYQAAGADGLFVPGVVAPAEIEALAAGTPLPLNVLARPGLPHASDLKRLGARRLSAGSGLTQGVYGYATQITEDFLRRGDSSRLSATGMTHADINELVARAAPAPA